MDATNAYTGTAKSVPDSRTPRRFTSVMNATNASERITRCWLRLGTAETIAKTPATTETETVRT
jgi:hypothetical protein